MAGAVAARRARRHSNSAIQDFTVTASALIATLVIFGLLLLGFGWWWAVHPRGDAFDRDAQLPLFSARTPGSVLRVIGASPRARRAAAVSAELPGDAIAAAATGAATPAPAPRAAVVPDREVPRVRVDETAPRAPASRPPARPATVTFDTNSLAAPPSAASTSFQPPATRDRVVPPIESASAIEDLKWAPPAQPAPTNGTIQFLPGRLEVVQGRGVAGQEVRFVRPSRPGERAVVTFGRGEGPPYRHVQLNVPTVSRLHARLALDDVSGGWTIENLSTTNPTVVNGEEVSAGDAPRALHDEDRVEMGEVVFTFYAQ